MVFLGFSFSIEATTASGSYVPDIADLEVKLVNSNNGYRKVKVTWKPNYTGTPGSHFYAQYREVGKPNFQSTHPQISDDVIEVDRLDANTKYEFRVVSVDGSYETPSSITYFDFNPKPFKVQEIASPAVAVLKFVSMTFRFFSLLSL